MAAASAALIATSATAHEGIWSGTTTVTWVVAFAGGPGGGGAGTVAMAIAVSE